MTHDFAAHPLYYVSIVCMWLAAGLNLFQVFRGLRSLRWNRAMREITWAYEKELIERGVTLPPRCPFCCQVLPRHVEGCPLTQYFAELGKFAEFMSRPPIKYFPKGERPPDTGRG